MKRSLSVTLILFLFGIVSYSQTQQDAAVITFNESLTGSQFIRGNLYVSNDFSASIEKNPIVESALNRRFMTRQIVSPVETKSRSLDGSLASPLTFGRSQISSSTLNTGCSSGQALTTQSIVINERPLPYGDHSEGLYYDNRHSNMSSDFGTVLLIGGLLVGGIGFAKMPSEEGSVLLIIGTAVAIGGLLW